MASSPRSSLARSRDRDPDPQWRCHLVRAAAAIFEPFRGRTTGSSRPGALGLGLFISQQIARAHDGDIGVDSSSTSGTVFTVRLPRRREHVTQTNAAEPLEDNRASTKIVLIVEDEEHIRESL